jgi:hypothetical protein
MTPKITVEPIDSGFESQYTTVNLASMPPRTSAVLPTQFLGRISNDSRGPVNMGKLKKTTTLGTRATLLGRTFNTSLMMKTLDVQYPVCIELIECPEQMSRGESKTFGLFIKNISTAVYGCDSNLSFGALSFKIMTDRRLPMIDPTTNQRFNMIERNIPFIAPNSSVCVLEFMASVTEDTELFERLVCQAELFLRGKKIEDKQALVRVAPDFLMMNDSNRDSFNLLMITDKHISKREFDLYMKICSILHLRPNFWDVGRYGYISNDENRPPWIDEFRGKTILFPVAHSDHVYRMSPANALSHFAQNNVSFNSSMVIIGGAPIGIKNHLVAGCEWEPLPAQKKFSLFTPKPKHMENKAKTFVKKKNNKEPSRIVDTSCNFHFKKLRLWYYEVGSGYSRRMPISGVEHILSIPTRTKEYLIYDQFDALRQPTIPIGSGFHHVFYAIIQAMPVAKKLSWLQLWLCERPPDLQFTDGTNVHSAIEVIQATLYWDIVSEFAFKDLGNTRAEEIVNYVTEKASSINSTEFFVLIWNLFMRLQKRSLPAAWSVVQKLFPKRQKFLKLKKDLKLVIMPRLKELGMETVEKEKNYKLNALVLDRPLLGEQIKKVHTLNHTAFSKKNWDF